MLNSLLSLPAEAGEVFRSLDTTPLPLTQFVYLYFERPRVGVTRFAA
jgi:hypothetical protein